jgi:hypothetical protein
MTVGLILRPSISRPAARRARVPMPAIDRKLLQRYFVGPEKFSLRISATSSGQ